MQMRLQPEVFQGGLRSRETVLGACTSWRPGDTRLLYLRRLDGVHCRSIDDRREEIAAQPDLCALGLQ
jgi:hypothetical protein